MDAELLQLLKPILEKDFPDATCEDHGSALRAIFPSQQRAEDALAWIDSSAFDPLFGAKRDKNGEITELRFNPAPFSHERYPEEIRVQFTEKLPNAVWISISDAEIVGRWVTAVQRPEPSTAEERHRQIQDDHDRHWMDDARRKQRKALAAQPHKK